MRILLVEDSVLLQRSVTRGLRAAGYAVDAIGNGMDGLRMACNTDYDEIILDLTLPALDGLDVLKRMRSAGRTTHVLVLTARDSVEDRVLGLRSGADDYLVKPFAFEELLARVDALIRRSQGTKDSHLRFGGLQIDLNAKTVHVDGRAVSLTPREYALLEFLALRKGQVVSRTEIEDHIYDERVDPLSNVVDTAIYSLRKKIDAPGVASLIQTRRGMGYVFQPESAGTETSCTPSVED
ncbi:MAG: response regulator transcription factor [Tepidisphaeraceae bacterium]|jgi:DNA-binding response OmpR family regulator